MWGHFFELVVLRHMNTRRFHQLPNPKSQWLLTNLSMSMSEFDKILAPGARFVRWVRWLVHDVKMAGDVARVIHSGRTKCVDRL
jgi:hypothetical protein